MAGYVPPFPDTPAQIAEGYSNVYGAFADMGVGNAVTDVAMLSDFADTIVADNFARYPRVSGAAMQATGEAYGALNSDLMQQYYASLDYISPGWRDKVLNTSVESGVSASQLALEYGINVLPQAMATSFSQFQQAQSANTAIMNGQMPADMVYSARQFARESASRQGVFGQAAANMETKGVAAMSLQAQADAMNQLSSVYGQAINPTAQGLQVMGSGLNALGTTASSLRAYQPPTVDISGLFTQNLAALTGTTLQSPNNIVSNMSAMQSTLLNAAQGAWSAVANYNNNAYVSQLNASAEAQNRLIMQNARGGNQMAGIFTGGASGAASGAAIGTMFAPGFGTIVGAGAGFVLGGAMGGYSANQQR